MRHYLLEFRATGPETLDDRWLATIATVLGRLRRFDEGLGMIDESFPFIERSGLGYFEAEVHRLKGALVDVDDGMTRWTRSAEKDNELRAPWQNGHLKLRFSLQLGPVSFDERF